MKIINSSQPHLIVSDKAVICVLNLSRIDAAGYPRNDLVARKSPSVRYRAGNRAQPFITQASAS